MLARQLTAYHGNITAENTIHNVVSIVQTGDLHSAVYNLPNEILFVSNARADSESVLMTGMQCRMREGRREGKEGGGGGGGGRGKGGEVGRERVERSERVGGWRRIEDGGGVQRKYEH